MKKLTITLLMLLGGCVTAEAEKDVNRGMCTKFMPVPDKKIECAGGRGVAPQICVEKTVIKQFCVRYETL